MKRIALPLCSLLLFVAPAFAQNSLLGRVLEKVTCAKDASQTYALYVPSHYTPQQAWPVIFCFDPGARGLEPVQRLHAAAEKYGFIVAGSLTSRNGAWAANVAAIQAMVGDVQSHLNLDPARVYTAGLSGGARVASQLAIAGMAKGCIVCSAGFPQGRDSVPESVSFLVFGTAGTEDFNYGELRRLDDQLDELKASHRVVIFDGSHEWAPAEVLGDAVLWLTIQEMRLGKRPKDDALIAANFAARVAAIPTEPVLEAWRAIKSIAADFKGLADVKDYEQKAKDLAGSKELKDARKAERDLAKREDTLASDLAESAGDSPSAMKKQVAALKVLADKPDDSPERRMARRVLGGGVVLARESVRGLIDSGQSDAAAGMLEMAVAIRPEQTRNYVELARLRAQMGDKAKAIAALQTAAEKGLSNAPRIEGDADLAKLKSDPAWPALIEKIRANPPEPPGRGRL